jgi:TolB-like protein
MQTKTIQPYTLSEASKKNVLAELERILESEMFSRSAVLSSFLKFITLETIENRSNGLKEYTIAVSALGKPSDFDPQTDAIVRIHAGRLRRLLNEYYTGPGDRAETKIELVKGTYVPVFRASGSHVKENIASNGIQTTQYFRSKLTLAVLPFRNLCPENEYQFFADGFGEEITRLFSTFQDLAVVAHHSTLKYVTSPDDVRHIGADLGAHYLINGWVKRTADEIRVSVGLIETMNGMQIWSQSYHYALNIESLTTIQDQIVENIGSILGGYYGFIAHNDFEKSQTATLSLESFDATLWNYYFHMNFSLEAYMKTRHALERTLQQNPNYARGLAMLAELYLDAFSLGYPTSKEPVKDGFDLAKKAIKLDPQCQHAWLIYGWANIYMKRKDEALKALERGLDLNPYSVSFKGSIGFGMACTGEYDRAKELLHESIDFNPHAPWWFYLGLFIVHYHSGNYKKSLEYADKIEAKDVFIGPLCRVVAKVEMGFTNDALEDLAELIEKFPIIAEDMRPYLNSFLLDTDIVDKMLSVSDKVTAAARKKHAI